MPTIKIKKLGKSGDSESIKILDESKKRAVFDIIAPVASFDVFKKEEKFFNVPAANPEESLVDKSFKERKNRRNYAGFLLVLLLIVFLAGGVYLAAAVLPRVEIKIVLNRKNFEFNESVNAAVKSLNLPAEIFSQKGNLLMLFPASGKKTVQVKAKAKLTIYNVYSSQPQNLVAATRFMTPEGRIFRLDKAVTVPGAKIADGKIVPSSITVNVTADKAGEAYNLGPAPRLTIPGFQGSPKYEGFYGELKEPASGGYVGEAAAPTAEESKEARVQIAQALEESLKQRVLSELPSGLKILDGASEFKILNEEINEKVPEPGRFGVFVDAEFKVITFRESDIKSFFLNKALGQIGEDYGVLTEEFEYGLARIDFNKGAISFPVKGRLVLRRRVDINGFRQAAAGKKEIELKTLVFALPDFEDGKISFWPFWVSRAPKDPNRITIDLQ